ncbi:acyl-ACP--UDP-N-acetylglucosamine O-acyltransferase [Candidatus Rariloculus sp.]|uniref:acyl-ACP--UDP-N-acetylglucosamine O-acyltransferase n=1 Tax=Candidatus Rariloculus sp. TaxID=3101265 RepID=UPI003D12B291
MIDERAVVDPSANVHDDAYVGPYAVIGADVEIRAGCRIGAHAVIKGPTRIGADNRIFPFASLGEDPQDKKYGGERTELVIGERNTIREYCTINRGTVQDQGWTRVGNDNWIMAYAHIAHDCVVGDHTIFANNASIAGHVHVGDYVVLGGFTAVHQYCRLGASALCSMFSYVTKDIPAYVIVSGRPIKPRGINAEGLKRRGFSAAAIRNIRDAYRVVYRQGSSLDDAIAELGARVEAQPELEPLVSSLSHGSRGLVR